MPSRIEILKKLAVAVLLRTCMCIRLNDTSECYQLLPELYDNQTAIAEGKFNMRLSLKCAHSRWPISLQRKQQSTMFLL